MCQTPLPDALLAGESLAITPPGTPPPLAVRRAKALPFQRAEGEMSDVLAAHDDLHTADGAPAWTCVTVGSGHPPRQRQRYDTSATAAGGQSLQALAPCHWPPLGAFIKLPALRVVHDLGNLASGGVHMEAEALGQDISQAERAISFRYAMHALVTILCDANGATELACDIMPTYD